ncbi:CPBP family intramembrane glutamic endopeptidase [Nocardia thailandica]
MRIRRWRRTYLAAEYVTVFFGGAALYRTRLRGVPPIPGLLVAGAGLTAYLRRAPDFDRRALWRAEALPGQGRALAATTASSALALTALTALIRRDRLFDLPRQRPWLWSAVMLAYPVLSVYPQELIFRSFLFHRYEPVFGKHIVAASAAAFGIVHLAFGGWISVALSGVAGRLLAERYLRTRSLATVTVEHSLYGMLVFTVGLGEFFYHGSAGQRPGFALSGGSDVRA